MTKQEENARETAMLAERHWWTMQIREVEQHIRARAEMATDESAEPAVHAWTMTADCLADIIAERTR